MADTMLMAKSSTNFSKDPTRLTATILFAIALVGFSIYALVNGNTEFIFYGIVLLILAGVVVAIDRSVHFSTAVVAGLLVWAILHLAGGNVPIGEPKIIDGVEKAGVLYNFRPAPWLPRFDQALHAFGFAVAALLCWECLRRAFKRDDGTPPTPTTGLAIACILMGIGLGALNEVVEFVAVLTMPDTNVGGYTNTGWDLVSNLAGATAMGIYIRLKG